MGRTFGSTALPPYLEPASYPLRELGETPARAAVFADDEIGELAATVNDAFDEIRCPRDGAPTGWHAMCKLPGRTTEAVARRLHQASRGSS
jgi:hypothetical protein